MEVEEKLYYSHRAVQRRTDELIGSWEEDKLFIIIKLFKRNSLRHNRRGVPVLMDPQIAQVDFSVKFSHIKQQQLCDSNLVEYETMICEHLKTLGVQEYEHPAIVDTIVIVVDAAVSPLDAVVVTVSDVTSIYGDLDGEPSLIPATRSSIQGLKPVKEVDSSHSSSSVCVICMEDFEGKPITRLPCTHHFQVDCIVQWLEINHLCPLRKYPMPIQEHSVWSSACKIIHPVWSFVLCMVLAVCDFMTAIWEHPLLQ